MFYLYGSKGCSRDCPNRKPGCQTVECPEYRKLRERLDAIKAGKEAEKNTMTKRAEAKLLNSKNQLKQYR